MNELVKNELDELARRIRHDLDLRETSREDWIKATLDLSVALVEARDNFRADISFGHWCDENGFDISHQDRAAYIAFGRDIGRAREILEKTESRSIQRIHRLEFRFTSASKPKPPKPDPGLATTPEMQKALDAYDFFKSAGVEPTQQQVEEKAGTSNMPVRRAFERRRTEAELARQEVDISDLPATSKAKVEAAVRKIQKRMELEYERRVQLGVQKFVTEFVMPTYAEKLALADRINGGKKPFSIEEYRKLLGALHPDSSSVERRTEMFLIVKQRELILRPPEKDKPLSGDLPKTIEELLERKRQVSEMRKRR